MDLIHVMHVADKNRAQFYEIKRIKNLDGLE